MKQQGWRGIRRRSTSPSRGTERWNVERFQRGRGRDCGFWSWRKSKSNGKGRERVEEIVDGKFYFDDVF